MLDLQTNTSNNDNTLQKVSALYGYSQSEISENLKDYDIPLKQNSMRTKQLWNWIFLKGIKEFSDIRNMPRDLLNKLSNDYTLKRNSVSTEQRSADGTIKWLLGLSNNGLSTPNEIETVFIPEEKRGTLCVSSQIGCTLNCSFCHTGTQKLIRNLTTEEIVSQLLIAKDRLNDWHGSEPDKLRKITNIVMMGMGEPLYNFEAVKKALLIMTDCDGLALSKRRVTLSTSGIVPFMERVGREIGVSLAVSLHSAKDDVRDILVPINKKYPLKELIKACENYPKLKNSSKITFEYVMLKDINDSIEDAKDLAKLLRNIPSKINLIPFNPWPGNNYQCSDMEQIKKFSELLNNAGFSCPIRKPRGQDIMAACGQLKSETVRLRKRN
jgi:23S rRNA (adenine2503-C2)-methyltransferase